MFSYSKNDVLLKEKKKKKKKKKTKKKPKKKTNNNNRKQQQQRRNLFDKHLVCINYDSESDVVHLTQAVVHLYMILLEITRLQWPRWLSWMRRPTGDQEIAGSTPAEVGKILSWRLIMKYFQRSFSPFRWFKKGSFWRNNVYNAG